MFYIQKLNLVFYDKIDIYINTPIKISSDENQDFSFYKGKTVISEMTVNIEMHIV